MINFTSKFEARLQAVLQTTVGVGSTDPVNKVKTFEDHLREFELTEFPVLVSFVRDGEAAGQDLNAPQGMRTYNVHIYYMDLNKTWLEGRERRSNIMSRIEKTINNDPRFGAFESVDDDDTREYIWDSEITSFNFDSSGQQEYYSFVGEMYLTVRTAT